MKFEVSVNYCFLNKKVRKRGVIGDTSARFRCRSKKNFSCTEVVPPVLYIAQSLIGGRIYTNLSNASSLCTELIGAYAYQATGVPSFPKIK